MAMASTNSTKVDTRVVYWGSSGSGKTTNLWAIQRRLGSEQSDAVEAIPTRLDPSVCYHRLAIELGGNIHARLELVAVPGAPEHTVTRKQLLDCVGGIVFVADASADRNAANVESLEELRASLAAYGRRLDAIPTVVQYNKSDLATPASLEDLRSKLQVPGAATVDAIAEQQSGVLETLTEIAKGVARNLRGATSSGGFARAPAVEEEPSAPATAAPSSGAPPAPSKEPAAPETQATAADPDPAADAEFARDPDPDSAMRAVADPKPARNSDPDPVARAALAAARGHVDPASDQLTARARSLLEPDWSAVAATPAPGGWSIAALGEPELAGPLALSVPLTLADNEGGELRFQLRISLETLGK